MPVYSLLADLIVFIHFLYVSFAVLGEAAVLIGALFRWKWIRNRVFRITHLVMVIFVALESILGVICPLTEWEYSLRGLAGKPADVELSFMARVIHKLIFYDLPDRFFMVLYIGFSLLVVLTLVFIPMKPRARKV